ncbi:MAG: Hsp20/alpha crystallin family protein [Acidimicrobiales bacterium]
MHLDPPGIDPSGIDLTVEKDVPTACAARRSWWNGSGEDAVEVLVAERPHSSYSRQMFLGETLDADRIEATHEHCTLALTIPVAEAAKPSNVLDPPAGG